MLEEQGYRVIVAGSGADAIESARRHDGALDLLLTDVVMPGMGGRGLWEALTKVRPAMKAIFMSGYSDEAMLHHGILPAGTGFLQKPFAAYTLARKVRETLERHP